MDGILLVKEMKNNRDVLLSKDDQEVLGELEEDSITEAVRRHVSNPSNMGVMMKPDGQAALMGICEDTVAIQLQMRGDKIDSARFQTNGCGFTLACGSVVTEMVKGKNIKVALGITGKKIDKALGGLPREHKHCADLAANVMKAAALDALMGAQNPWMRSYRSPI